ncbi:putative uncharacterized protein DDB_G0277255 [Mangifera indica]|uniref:putative uncharacterized protein DDB_G0277255 n=1 Tax=Mangifera indica TaxID=29780 RepID=UPI001CFAF735|nr:putative uncharacterized protein DDB_G0277255 [Mangifera indica]
MDSGNSGSMQSSSGGDEEYDSRAETISVFLNPLPPQQPPQQQPHHQHHHHDSMFDPFSNYFDTASRSSNQNSLLNLDMVWAKNLRSEPDLGGAFMAASASSSSSTQQLFTNQAVLPSARANNFSPLHGLPHHHHNQTESVSVSGFNIDKTNPIITTNSGGGGGGIGNNNLVRNPKKRSRASRRAPTTVLTTDTSNFRAMVQEFTGIPAPPFTSSAFPRSRLDLFGSSTSLRSSSHLDHSPPYLLRPFAQKFHSLPPFVSPPSSTPSPSSSSSPSMIDAIAAAASTSTNLTSATPGNNNNNTNINYQNLLNMNNSTMQNPVLNLQSLLQPQTKFPLSNSPILANKPQGSSSSLDKIGVLEELGLSGHGHLNTNLNSGGLQNIVSSSTPTFDNDQAAAVAGTANESEHQGLLRSPSFSGGNNYNNNNSHQRVSNGKVNTFSASSSDFHREKVQENVSTRTRTEGMVESWICSSD